MNTTPGRRQAEVEALGKTIQAERTALGLTLDSLAERTGIHRNTIHAYERSKQEVPFGKLVDIAEGLGLSTLELLRLAEERAERESRNTGRGGTT